MGSLLSYSGITTKIRAMHSKLLTSDQIREISGLPDVSHVAAYIKNQPGYSSDWAGIDENNIHRGQLEKKLRSTLYRDYAKLYNFANREQREFLVLYSQKYEIRELKDVLINIFDRHETQTMDLDDYEYYIGHHTPLDLPTVAKSTSLESFLEIMQNTEYASLLNEISHRGNATYFDYSMGLDLYYFSEVRNKGRKLFSGQDLEELNRTYGQKCDLLNLQFIERAKNSLGMSPDLILALTIPLHYHLQKSVIKELTDAPTPEAFEKVLKTTYYGKINERIKAPDMEKLYDALFQDILSKEARRHPHSIATLYYYLYEKEEEVNRIIRAMECVRYQVRPEEAVYYLG